MKINLRFQEYEIELTAGGSGLFMLLYLRLTPLADMQLTVLRTASFRKPQGRNLNNRERKIVDKLYENIFSPARVESIK